MPDGMRMMVPSNLAALDGHSLFSNSARKAYAAEPGRARELKTVAPQQDEPVASFVTRHFGDEVLRVVGAPLLNGVFGGDVRRLSVQAVMAPFVKMEREYGSLIEGRSAARRRTRGQAASADIYHSALRHGDPGGQYGCESSDADRCTEDHRA